jgi:hypothetical protein
LVAAQFTLLGRKAIAWLVALVMRKEVAGNLGFSNLKGEGEDLCC